MEFVLVNFSSTLRWSLRHPFGMARGDNGDNVRIKDHQKANDESSKNMYADPNNIKLKKRLEYLLRYGAIKEGLQVSTRGYVKLTDIMSVPLFSKYTKETLITEIDAAISERGNKMYEMKTEGGETYIKSLFTRKFERSPYHDDSKVVRLLEMCLRKVCTNITDYSLEGFPDEYVIGEIVFRLKRENKLNNKTLPSIISPHLQELDLSNAYLTTGSLKLVMTCTNLRKLNLAQCGYLLNDELLKRLMKNLPLLNNLDVCSCSHLTSLSLHNICKLLPGIRCLRVARIRNFKEADVLKLIESCKEMTFLDINSCKLPLTDAFRAELAKFSCTRPNLVIIRK